MRPFQVIGIQQIAIGSEDKEKLARFWIDIMGLEKVKTFKSEMENVDEDVLKIGDGPHAVPHRKFQFSERFFRISQVRVDNSG